MKLFSAPWCKFCTPVKQKVKELGLDVEILNIDEDIDAALEHAISQIPALVKDDGSILVESQEIIKYLEGLNA